MSMTFRVVHKSIESANAWHREKMLHGIERTEHLNILVLSVTKNQRMEDAAE